jgi:hypothetical protein
MLSPVFPSTEASLHTLMGKPSPCRAGLSALVALALAFSHVPAAAAAPLMTRAEYEACQARDEPAFRGAIETVTRKGLEGSLVGLDYKAVLREEWRRGNVDDVIDRQVDLAVGQVREESSWMQLLQSLASAGKAQELATTVAERVYRSEAMKKAIEEMASGVGREIGKRIEAAAADTAAPAVECMQAFLGRRYGSTVARAVSADAGRQISIDPAKFGAQVSTGQVLLEGGEGIAGAVILVVRRQLSTIASRVGQRIVGSVLGRLVSVVGGGVGLVLVAKDIWDFRHGVLPIIAEEMKSQATKDKVRDELAAMLSEHVSDSIKDIAAASATRVVEIWTDFRRAHAKVLELAERNDGFKRFLDQIKGADMPRLDEVVGLVLASEGEAGVLKRLDDGTLHQAVTALPGDALEIAREARSLEVAFKWWAIAGDNLTKVVGFELHRRADPQSFTKPSLNRLLALQDRVIITRLASLQPAARDVLFELDAGELRTLARSLDEDELASLSRYLSVLSTAPAQRLLRAVVQSPSRMAELAKPGVRDAVIASADQLAAVGMMLHTSTLPNPGVVFEHARLALDGRIAPRLLWEKHAFAMAIAALLSLLLALLLWRLLLGTRPRVILQPAATVAPKARGGR